CGKGTHLTF
nr:immunoglobulin light chain junction region [Macaca mulatta]MOW62092.1 immunoglobulin light chain junction region [Macaca mulatta]MOW62150.1 immunoglobulin light chain junction region [Macaca mulatta]MOW62354.1 immunoglobulin light chain junction region [Macaca mulatta]MOW62932.1 immunoglobulin light chain junction region [Macaca mulatta]